MTDTTSSDYPCNCRSCGTIISLSVTDMCEECEIAAERHYEKFYTPMTDTTTNFDPIPRLQQIATTIREVGGIADIFASPATSAYDIECAIKEIERLHRDYSCICGQMRRMMEERDEAMALIENIAKEVNVLSARPTAIIKFSDLVDQINEWGDTARNILDKKANSNV